MIFGFGLMASGHMPFDIWKAAGGVLTFGLQAVEAVIAGEVLDQGALVFRLGFAIFQLFDGSQTITAEAFDCRIQLRTGQTVRVGAQMALLAATPWKNAGLTNATYNNLMRRIVREHCVEPSSLLMAGLQDEFGG